MSGTNEQGLRGRLRAITIFLAIFETPGFHFGGWNEKTVFYHFSNEASAFVDVAYEAGLVLKDFNWVKWSQTAEAARLREDRFAIEGASAAPLAKLITALLRGDRFSEGSLGASYENGLLTRIIRRAVALAESPVATAVVFTSAYLNPFQPFPEREVNPEKDGDVGAAIENNLSRAVFSALANAEDGRAAAIFLRELKRAGSSALHETVNACRDVLLRPDGVKIEFGLQKWPASVEISSIRHVLLVGISSSHASKWTHKHRCVPANPIADAWLHVPGELLVVFECKNDEHPQDATQIGFYAHKLGLLKREQDFTCPAVGESLHCPEDAERVQRACADVVLDVSWSLAVEALRQVESELPATSRGSWLSGWAAAYVQSHLFPPYRGTPMILDWLEGEDLPDRRLHLRRLVSRFGESLGRGPIHVLIKRDGTPEMKPGAGSAVFVQLAENGGPVQAAWLGEEVAAVLWFRFARDESERVGLEFYLQAGGSHSSGKGDAVSAWNKASKKHLSHAKTLAEAVEGWSNTAPRDAKVIVSSVRFKGKKQSWQGGGEDAREVNSGSLSPIEALEFLKENQLKLWCFPEVQSEDQIVEAARKVRKPALALVMPLDAGQLRECGDDSSRLQDVLQKAITNSEKR
jgi:hypothetical protein